MLGCHDFCGYYEWTFHYLRRNFGNEGVQKYWAKAIAADSQRHYIAAAAERGLSGLQESWLKTGVDEQCDWTVTFDENRNWLRLDMQECPSKGFLLKNNLNADEDYCDHCMGWIGPALHSIGIEVAGHEHNHCGQCWWDIRAIDRDQPECKSEADIRDDPRWAHGYLHRYSHHEKLSLLSDNTLVDSCDVIVEWFRDTDEIIAPASANYSRREDHNQLGARAALVVSGASYANAKGADENLRAVVVEHRSDLLPAIASRYQAAKCRPLLLHPFLPGEPMLNFQEHGLPRPVPLLPLLIRSGVYHHSAHSKSPDTDELITLLASALQKRLV